MSPFDGIPPPSAMAASRSGSGRGNDSALPGSALRAAEKLPARAVHARLRQAVRDEDRARSRVVVWFAELVRRKLHRELGYGSVQQYAELELGFSRVRTAQHLRLAEALERLPGVREELSRGELPWTKAREVVRVARPESERAWLEVARTLPRRELERRVAEALEAAGRPGGRSVGCRASRPTGGELFQEPSEVPAPRPRAGGSLGMPLGAGTQRSKEGAGGSGGGGNSTEGPGGDVTATRAAVRGEPGPGSSGGTSGLGSASDGLAPVPVPMPAAVPGPVAVSFRFPAALYARFEALMETLRKQDRRATREELLVQALERLAAEGATGPAGTPGAAAAASTPGTKAAGATGPAPLAADPAPAAAPGTDPGGVSARERRVGAAPVYQVVLRVCERCGRGQAPTSRGARTIPPAELRAALCDARIRPPGGKNRSAIPPAVRRDVLARDGYRCRSAGCGSARFLAVHHRVPREKGGSNRPENLVTLCGSCHRALHFHPDPPGG